jgi:TRAP-type mannitol/chloroaromatic compound transport system permease small subunit
MRYIFFIDQISLWVGKVFAWCIVLLTLTVSMEVMMRYVFSMPTAWAYDASYMLYGTLFMMGGAYALSQSAHVRADVASRYFPIRVHAAVDLALYIVFFYPGILALAWVGWDFFAVSFRQNEHSSMTPGGPPVWPYKFVIPLSATLLAIQGIAEVSRCIICLKQGKWPARLGDVEEIESAQHMEEIQQSQEDPRS